MIYQPLKNYFMEMNFPALLVAAFPTLIVGFIWYNPKVFGTIRMKESGMTEENMKGGKEEICSLHLEFPFFMPFSSV